MGKTSIQWTDHSINPIRARNPLTGAVGHYCEKISSGCAHCYASGLQKRFQMPDFPGQTKGGSLCLGETETVHVGDLEIFLDESKLDSVLRRRKPTKYFWCDMTDMFGWWVYEEWLDKCFAVMATTPHHTHQILTKRPERAFEYLGTPDRHNTLEVTADELRPGKGHPSFGGKHMLPGLPLRNVWLGVSAENQREWDHRVQILRQINARVRFVSVEPMLEEINPYKQLFVTEDCEYVGSPRQQIDWVILGGESGRGARPCRVEWIRRFRDNSKAANVACFIKQMGANVVTRNDMVEDAFNGRDGWPDPHVEYDIHGFREDYQGADCRIRLRDSHGGDWDEWPEDLRVREFPKSALALTGG